MSFDIGAFILGAVGTGLDIAGKLAEAEAYADFAEYQASVADKNAAIQEQNAVNAIDATQQTQVDQDAKASFLQGQIVAAQGASGLSTTGRSAVMTRASARRLAQLDRERIREAGDVEAANFRMAAADARDAADYARDEAKNARSAGWLGAASSLVGGAGRIASNWAYRSPAPTIGAAGANIGGGVT